MTAAPLPPPPPPDIDRIADRLLRRAAELAATTRLAKGCDARDDRGRRCPATSNEATSRSVAGLLDRAAQEAARRPTRTPARARALEEARTRATRLLDKVAGDVYGRTASDVNDDPGTGSETVVFLLVTARLQLAAASPPAPFRDPTWVQVHEPVADLCARLLRDRPAKQT